MADDELLTTPAQPVDGKPGTTDTAILVMFPHGAVVPVGVQAGHTAAEYIPIYQEGGNIVVGVRRGGVTTDLLRDPADVVREAHRLLLEDPILRYRAEVTERIMRAYRTGGPAFAPRRDADSDLLIAAVALVVTQVELPGGHTGK